jgi:hypothetical protein
VEILLRIYAKCLDGGDAEIRRRAQAALGHADKDRNVDTRLDTDVRPRPDLTGYRRTHNPAADPRFCWSAAGLCWWWMVAPTYPYANRVPLVTGPTIRLAAPRSRAGADG